MDLDSDLDSGAESSFGICFRFWRFWNVFCFSRA